MVTSTDFRGLLNQRFAKNFFPIPATSRWDVGLMPPDFQLPNITQGGTVRLSEYRDRKLAIVAFTRIFTEKQYCPLCFPHIKELNEQYEAFTDRGAEVLLITSTDAQQSEIVVRDLGLKMPLLCDPDCITFRAYAVGQALGAPLPAQFVLDNRGILRYKHLFSFLHPNAEIQTLLTVLDEL